MNEMDYCIVFVSNAKYINDFGPICVVCFDGQIVAPFSIGSSKKGKTYLGLVREGAEFLVCSGLKSCKRDCDVLNVNWNDLGYFFPVPYYILPALAYEDLRYKRECKGV